MQCKRLSTCPNISNRLIASRGSLHDKRYDQALLASSFALYASSRAPPLPTRRNTQDTSRPATSFAVAGSSHHCFVRWSITLPQSRSASVLYFYYEKMDQKLKSSARSSDTSNAEVSASSPARTSFATRCAFCTKSYKETRLLDCSRCRSECCHSAFTVYERLDTDQIAITATSYCVSLLTNRNLCIAHIAPIERRLPTARLERPQRRGKLQHPV